MGECEICNIVHKKSKLKIYEDDTVTAILNPKPSVPGHVLVFTKKHYSIIEQVPDYEVEKLFNVANKISKSMFDSLGITGTNIILNNGIPAGQKYPHVVVNIIPRTDNDALKLEWIPKKADESELSTVELLMKENSASLGIKEKEKAAPIEIESKPESIETSKNSRPEDNMLIKQLRRIP